MTTFCGRPTPLVIAEIGIAHEGDVHRALQYVRDAHACGADGVKLQYQMPELDTTEDHPWRETLERCQLTHEEHRSVREQARALGMLYGCTPFCVEAVERIVDLDPDYIKVGGGGWSNRPMVDAVRETGLPTVASMACGGRYLELHWASIVLVTASQYPTPPNVAFDLASLAGGVYGYGFSDHSGIPGPSLVALGAGAPMIEVHFPEEGPDTGASLNAEQLTHICEVAAVLRGVPQPAAYIHDPEITRLAMHHESKGWRRSG